MGRETVWRCRDGTWTARFTYGRLPWLPRPRGRTFAVVFGAANRDAALKELQRYRDQLTSAGLRVT